MPLELNYHKAAGKLTKEALNCNFSDLHHPYDALRAKAEADRCIYCYDAPCIQACPTSIDIPTFIHQIRADNINGSAETILSENIMGGTCARACPTEVLCEQACVLNVSHEQPVEIGALQRFSVDHLLEHSNSHPFGRNPLTGKSISIIGGGPAGLSCAHRLSMLGHEVTIFEAKQKLGGLNEYGLAAYKMADDFAQREVSFLLDIGGISIEYGQTLGKNILMDELIKNYDAVFLSVGLQNTNSLGLDNEDQEPVEDAIQFIEKLRQTEDKSNMTVGNDVVVIGAGNTAIDAAIQAKRLGADNVSLVYRRDEDAMSATDFEIELARKNDVRLQLCASPSKISNNETGTSIEFNLIENIDGKLNETGEKVTFSTDMILKAIGQKLDTSLFSDNLLAEEHSIKILDGKIMVDDYSTSIRGVFAGGDCINSDEDLTVQSVEDGKQAAHAIDRYLSAEQSQTVQHSQNKGGV